MKLFGGDEVWRFRLKVHNVLRISNATAQILHFMWWNFSVEMEFGGSGCCCNFCGNTFKWGEGWRFIMFCAFPMQLLKILHFMWWNFLVEMRFGGSGWRFIRFYTMSMESFSRWRIVICILRWQIVFLLFAFRGDELLSAFIGDKLLSALSTFRGDELLSTLSAFRGDELFSFCLHLEVTNYFLFVCI